MLYATYYCIISTHVYALCNIWNYRLYSITSKFKKIGYLFAVCGIVHKFLHGNQIKPILLSVYCCSTKQSKSYQLLSMSVFQFGLQQPAKVLKS